MCPPYADGADPVEHAGGADWEEMYRINVLTALRTTQELLPAQASNTVLDRR